MKRVSQIFNLLFLCLLEAKIPNREKIEIIQNDIVAKLTLFKFKDINIEYEIRELMDHNHQIFEKLNTFTAKNFIEIYIPTMGKGSIFITEIKLQKISEYKKDKRSKLIKEILK